MNYRSVVVLGTAVEVTDETERLVALETISEHIIRGRWTEIRPPNPLELEATRVLRLPIEEASAKVRTGPPVDDEEDYDLRCWASRPEHARIQGFTAGDNRDAEDEGGAGAEGRRRLRDGRA